MKCNCAKFRKINPKQAALIDGRSIVEDDFFFKETGNYKRLYPCDLEVMTTWQIKCSKCSKLHGESTVTNKVNGYFVDWSHSFYNIEMPEDFRIQFIENSFYLHLEKPQGKLWIAGVVDKQFMYSNVREVLPYEFLNNWAGSRLPWYKNGEWEKQKLFHAMFWNTDLYRLHKKWADHNCKTTQR